MFESLSDRLQSVLGELRGHGKLSEADIDKAMREIRLALLEADVNFKVVREFVAHVKERALGAGGDGEPHARPAGREDRQRGAHGADGRRRLKLAFSGHPPTIILHGRPAGFRQDDRLRQAGQVPARRTASIRC